ncbi:MAG: mechanosensitive ion channel family protein [Paracoccaceae bacterium]
MTFLIQRFLPVLLAIFVIFGPVSAQDSSSSDSLAKAIEQAADAGVSVVVIDSTGSVVSSADTEVETAALDDGSGSALRQAQSEVTRFREALDSRLAALPYSIFEVKAVLRQTSPDGRIMTFVEIAGYSLLLLLLGRWLSIEIYGKRIARRWVVSQIKENPQGYTDKMPFLMMRFVTGLGATIVALVLAYISGVLIFGPANDPAVQFTYTTVFFTFFAARTLSDLWRMILSPYLAQYRIPRLSDREAKRLYYWASILATYDISTVMFATWVGDFGLNYNVSALVYGVLTLGGLLGSILMILFNAPAISRSIRAGRARADVSWILRIVSVAWAPISIVYMVFSWLELSFDLVLERDVSVPLIVGSYGVLMTIIIVYGAINYLIERFFSRSREMRQMNEDAAADPYFAADGDAPDAQPVKYQHPINSFEALARRAAGILAFAAGSFALVGIWDPDIPWMSDANMEGALDVTIILFIGYVTYHFFRLWIDDKIAEETVDAPSGELGDEGGAGSASRLATLLPLFRGAILAVVVVSITLIILLELGFNVSPLFAGAGVVGLAVGFGSQALVRDIFSGAFFLVDDAFRKGEYIDIGSVKGTVEKISLRSFQLRHHLGALHTIPFGEIQVLTNYSRDWVIMKLKLRVTYDTDVEKVRKLIKNLGQELLDDPVIGDNFIQPLKSQGVIEMQDSAMIIRVKFMTKPGDQWLVRKKVYQDIRELFAREGIKFAHREVTVRVASDQEESLTPQQKEAAIGAAQAAIDEDMMDVNDGGDDR